MPGRANFRERASAPGGRGCEQVGPWAMWSGPEVALSQVIGSTGDRVAGDRAPAWGARRWTATLFHHRSRLTVPHRLAVAPSAPMWSREGASAVKILVVVGSGAFDALVEQI